MALGKRTSESQFSPAGSAPPPPPPPPPSGEPFTAPPPPAIAITTDVATTDTAGHDAPEEARADVVTALDARLQELQATVAALVDKSIDPTSVMAPHPSPTPEPATTEVPGDLDADVLESSRTLQVAKRTADALLTEARDEAAEITRAAREQADRELETQRQALETEQLAWEQRRRELVTLFEELDELMSSQRSHADRAHEVVRQLLTGPVVDPIVEVPEPTAAAGSEDSPMAEVIDLNTPPTVPTPTFEPHDESATVPAFTATAATTAETGFHIVTQPGGAAPEAGADAPHIFGAPPEEAGTVFGTPPGEPDAVAPAETPPTPFYPWGNDQQSPAALASEDDPPTPAPPVQRRGLFGH